jgi:hypothetical protein
MAARHLYRSTVGVDQPLKAFDNQVTDRAVKEKNFAKTMWVPDA